ncbi:MAG: hypothetical protein QF395_09675, partial [Arenicellales bacterium]|nr:hypothetical protein [Arenicellales bacterium]
IVDVNVPVTVGGLTVSPGDIVMGDQHGVIGIPKEIAAGIPAAAEKVEQRERTIIDLCNSPDFDLAGCGKMGSEIAKRAMLSVYPGLLASLVGVEGV